MYHEPVPSGEVPWHALINQLSDTMAGIMPPIDPSTAPEHSSIADQFLLRAIETLGSTLNQQLVEMNSRLDKMDGRFQEMVSQGEFRAEIKRLERENEILAEDVANLAEIHRKDVALWEAQRERDKEETAGFLQAKVVRFRWFTGVALSGFSAITVIVFGILNISGS